MTYYGPDWLYNAHHFMSSIIEDPNDNDFSKWLYGSWSKEKYDQYLFLNEVPVVREYMDYLLSRRSDSEYLNRYGMDYTDIHDPRKLHTTQSTQRLVGASYNFVSKNVGRLYR